MGCSSQVKQAHEREDGNLGGYLKLQHYQYFEVNDKQSNTTHETILQDEKFSNNHFVNYIWEVTEILC